MADFVEAGFKIARATVELTRPLDEKKGRRKLHPWESWMQEHLPSRSSRRVSRMVMGHVPEGASGEEVTKVVEEVVASAQGEVLVRGSRRGVSDSGGVMALGIGKNMDEVMDRFIAAGESKWMGVGIAVDEAGIRRLIACGDHLAADGNTHMAIVEQVADKLGVRADKAEQGCVYRDGEKIVVGKVVSEEFRDDYVVLLHQLCEKLFKDGKFNKEIWVSIPVQATVDGTERLIPAVVDFKQGEGVEELRRKVKQAVKSTKQDPSSSLTAGWMALTSEGSKPGRQMYKTMQHMPIVGKPVADRLKGDVLLSVMEVNTIPVASTTILPRENSLVCTVVRDTNRQVRSVAVSGNGNHWGREELRDILENLG